MARRPAPCRARRRRRRGRGSGRRPARPPSTVASSRSAAASSSAPAPESTARARAGGRPSSRRRASAGPASRPGRRGGRRRAPRGGAGGSARAAARRRRGGPTQPGGAGQQGQGLLGGPVARREQLLVEVEEGHDVGARHPVQHRLGADVDRGASAQPRSSAVAPVTSTTGRPAAASSSSRSRLTPGRSTTSALEPHTLADDRALGPAAARSAAAPSSGLGHRGLAALAARAAPGTRGRPAAGPGRAC